MFFVLWSTKGDLDYFAKGLGLKHYGRDDFCECCSAEVTNGIDPEYHAYNFRLSAAWKLNLNTRRSWRDSKGHRMHVLFAKLPFLSCLNLEPDELHAIYLCVASYVLGSDNHMRLLSPMRFVVDSP